MYIIHFEAQKREPKQLHFEAQKREPVKLEISKNLKLHFS